MKTLRSILFLGALLFSGAAYATCSGPFSANNSSLIAQTIVVGVDPVTGNCGTNTVTGAVPTNPATTQTLASSTTAYTAGQMIANSATAASVVPMSFTVSNAGGAAWFNAGRLYISDTTSTGPWFGVQIQLTIFNATTTYNTGDRGLYSLKTGSGGAIGNMLCTMNQTQGATNDGAWGRCAMVGAAATVRFGAGLSTLYVDAMATSNSLATAASGIVMTFVPEIAN
jgi:hypothetical protein